MSETSFTTPWRKATDSGENNCVEVRRNGTNIEVRDTKDPAGGALSFTPDEVVAFVSGLHKGEFNDLI